MLVYFAVFCLDSHFRSVYSQFLQFVLLHSSVDILLEVESRQRESLITCLSLSDSFVLC